MLTAILIWIALLLLLSAWLVWGRHGWRTAGTLADGYLEIPYKGGHNDLGRWKQFGGTLDRPPPPAPMNSARSASSDS